MTSARAAHEELSAFPCERASGDRASLAAELRALALTPPDFDSSWRRWSASSARMLRQAARARAQRVRASCSPSAARGASPSRRALRDAERELGLLATAIFAAWGERAASCRRRWRCCWRPSSTRRWCAWRATTRAPAERPRRSARLAPRAPRARRSVSELVMVLDRRGAARAWPRALTSSARAQAERAGRPAGRGAALRGAAQRREVAAARARVRNAKTGEERMCETRALPLHDGATSSPAPSSSRAT